MSNTIRILGQEIPRLGMGCWAIGGTWISNGTPLGWTDVKDESSIEALQKAYDLGIRLYDTAATYGFGHSEKVIGKALSHVRHNIIIASKFGYPCDDMKKIYLGEVTNKESILAECEDSLRRLKTDYIDIYQLHINNMSTEKLPEVTDALDTLVTQGKIRSYGWSTDFVTSAEEILNTSNCEFIQFDLNIFRNNTEMISLLDKHMAIGLNRQPLAMGLLTGKFNPTSKIADDDIRASGVEWLTYFKNGMPNPEYLTMLDALQSILTSKGRSLAQGSLAWILGSGDRLVPIPGFKRTEQVVQNIATLDFPPLTPQEISEINTLIHAQLQ